MEGFGELPDDQAEPCGGRTRTGSDGSFILMSQLLGLAPGNTLYCPWHLGQSL